MNIFESLAENWWDPQGPFRVLHRLNPVRLNFIVNHLRDHFPGRWPDISILDVGCGGGLLTEPLARLGCRVTGYDESAEAVEVADHHSSRQELNIDYVTRWPAEKFDVVITSEVIEHVDSPRDFITRCSESLKDDGALFISTINRTWQSFLGAIIAAEYLLRWAPPGTHNWKHFLPPEELASYLMEYGLEVKDIQGMSYDVLHRQWELSHKTSINYFLYASRNRLLSQ